MAYYTSVFTSMIVAIALADSQTCVDSESCVAGASMLALKATPSRVLEQQNDGAVMKYNGTGDESGKQDGLLAALDLSAGFDFKSLSSPSANPHMNEIKDIDANAIVALFRHISDGAKKHNLKLKLLDVGGNSGKDYENQIATLVDYTSLDFVKTPPFGGNKKSVVGNVMQYNADIADGSYQIVSALNVFEHLVAPWEAAKEMKRLTENGGFMLVMAPFSWRYHAYPLDTLRYTHTEMRYLFEHLGGVKTLFTGYKFHGADKHGHLQGHVDEPPDSHLQQNVEVLWIGRKIDGEQFDPESLDHYTGFNSPIAPSLPENEEGKGL